MVVIGVCMDGSNMGIHVGNKGLDCTNIGLYVSNLDMYVGNIGMHGAPMRSLWLNQGYLC